MSSKSLYKNSNYGQEKNKKKKTNNRFSSRNNRGKKSKQYGNKKNNNSNYGSKKKDPNKAIWQKVAENDFLVKATVYVDPSIRKKDFYHDAQEYMNHVNCQVIELNTFMSENDEKVV